VSDAGPAPDRLVQARAVVRGWCIEAAGDGTDPAAPTWEEGPPGTFTIVLPGEHRQRTTVSAVVGEHMLTVSAFVMRRPAQDAARVHQRLLERNRRSYTLAFACDQHGDVYLVGRRGITGLDTAEVDRLMAAVHQGTDGVFDELIALGFADAIRAEYAWRTARSLPTAHLAAFTGVLSPERSLPMPDRTLILLRHGESQWNAANLFTGWVDVDLTERGEQEARRAGELLRQAGLAPDVVHTSLLTRAIRTADIALAAAGRLWIPVRRSWRLNERHYGALQGLNKSETLARYGPQQFAAWRRSYDIPPPPIEPGSEYAQDGDPRYADVPPGELPATECLADVVTRMRPYRDGPLAEDLRTRDCVLVVAHGNSLRALIMDLDGLDAAAVAELNVPTGIPLVYRCDENLRPREPGAYLDPVAAEAAIAAVAAQGQPVAPA